jgi:protease IV
MKKVRIIIWTVVTLWLAAYIISLGLGEESGVVSKGIAIVPVKGTILAESSNDVFGRSGMGSEAIIGNLKRAEKNKGIKAIVLEINSPGGTVVASREVAGYVRKVSENKPVVAWIREVGASGAYWVASGADFIIADELSITGSVGVISSYLEFSGLMEKYGVGYERLVAGELKDVGSPYRDLNERERRLMEGKLEKIQEVFVKEVAGNRDLKAGQVEEIKSGFFYLGSEAKELGLVDELGGRELAVAKAEELADIEDGSVVEYRPKKTILEYLEKFSNKAFLNIGKGIGVSFFKGEREYEIYAM